MQYYQRLKDLREDADKNQTEIAKLLNATQTAYSKWEKGQRNITIESLITLARYYNVDMNYITGVTNIAHPFPKKSN